MRNAGKSYVKWNLALDQNRGPNTSQLGSSYSGCNTCSGLITVNTNSGAPTKTIEYYTMGQYSKFIKQGAIRVWSSDTPVVVSSAYINPDGTPRAGGLQQLLRQHHLPGGSGVHRTSTTRCLHTLLQPSSGAEPRQEPPLRARPSRFRAPSFTNRDWIGDRGDNGLHRLLRSGICGRWCDGLLQERQLRHGRQPGQREGRQRRAADGTVEFHLDSPTGTKLGTATLPVTGGYQTWQTVSAPVSTTMGVHDLYMVIHGSGGIGNVNWFSIPIGCHPPRAAGKPGPAAFLCPQQGASILRTMTL